MTSRSSTGLRPGSMVARVDDVHEGRAALDVAQEVVAEAAAVGGALDQSGHVGDGERHVAGAHDPEVGHQRGERVVGDLGPRARHRGDQRRLAGAGEADQPDVGDHLELETDLDLVAGLTEEGEAGGLALAAGQRGVAEPAATALGDHHLGAGADHVGEDLAAGGLDQRAVGHGQDQVAAVCTVAVRTGTVATVVGLALVAVVVVDQRGDVGVDAQDHRAAGTTVAAVRSAEGLELLPVHRRDTVAAPAGADVQRDLVDEGGDSHGRFLTMNEMAQRAPPESRDALRGRSRT